MKLYDHLIVGAGPAGLTLATYLGGRNAIVERHTVAGGCHRVDPAYEQFVEHGPRVYSGSYVNMHAVFRRIGLDWTEHFTRVHYSPELIDGQHWYQWMRAAEIAWLTLDFLVYCLVPNHGKTISMRQYGRCRGFCAKTMDRIDLVCRWSDGGGADRYTLWQFLSGLDQHSRPFYVPTRPLGGVFAHWVSWLRSRGCDVRLGTNATRATAHWVDTDAGRLRANKVILCVPPLYASRLLQKPPVFDAFARATKYNPYWSVSFTGAEWDNAKGQRSTPYGIVAIQYPFGVVSAAATRFDVPNEHGRKLKDLSDDEAAREIRRQLGLGDARYAYLKGPYNDQSFVVTPGHHAHATEVDGVSVVGTLNGRSSYHFTSMESAIQNALAYAKRRRRSSLSVSDGVLGGVLGLLLWFVL